jgi:hypothetical protein
MPMLRAASLLLVVPAVAIPGGAAGPPGVNIVA